MAVSVVHPITPALQRTGLVLFKPFDLTKWFLLGFCAFLAHLGQGGGGGMGRWSVPGGGGGGGGSPVPPVIDWIRANTPLVIAVSLVVVLLILGLIALICWVRSRGKFMYLDGLVRNRGAVAAPWRQFATLGNELFVVALLLAVMGMTASLTILALASLIAWPDIRAWEFGPRALTAVAVGGVMMFGTALLLLIINLLLEHLVVPTMYLRQLPVLPAWSTVRRELLKGHGGSIVLFFLMRVGLSLVIGAIAVAATCATCCATAIPYLGTVILLPLFVFDRCYTLCFLEQYGPSWRFFDDEGAMIQCARCGYDLRGFGASGVCPECGGPFGSVPPPVRPI